MALPHSIIVVEGIQEAEVDMMVIHEVRDCSLPASLLACLLIDSLVDFPYDRDRRGGSRSPSRSRSPPRGRRREPEPDSALEKLNSMIVHSCPFALT